jgi:YggT family protein
MFDTIIRILGQALIFVIILDVVLTYFMRPDQPLRYALDQIVNPLLEPIRKLLPQGIGIDFSPMVLIIIIEIIQMLLIGLF